MSKQTGFFSIKRAGALLLVLMLIFMTACSGASDAAEQQEASAAPAEQQEASAVPAEQQPSGETPAASTAPAPDANEVRPEPAEATGVSYPIAGAEGIVLDYWCPIQADATKIVTSYNESESWQEVMARTGVELKFIHPATGQEKESFNILMASGDLPDIIQAAHFYGGGTLDSGGQSKGVIDGAFLDLTPYLEQYAPDYYRIINSDPELRREIYTETDIVPVFYKIIRDPIPPFNRPILRADWLEEFGMSEPVTLDEFEAYMEQVATVKNVTPFIPNGDAVLEENWTGAFDFLPEWYHVDGKVYYGKVSPNLKEYLTWFNDLYQKGYVSRDFPAMDEVQRRAEFDAGNSGLYVDMVDNARSRTLELPIEVTSSPYPRKTADSKVHTALDGWPRDNADSAAVAATCENPEIAIQFLNYAYSDEGSMLYNYGIEGKTYNMVDGKPKYTDHILNNPDIPTTSSNYILRIHFAPKYVVGTPLEFNPTIAKSPEAVAFREKWADDPNADNSYRLPPFTLTPEANTARAEIMTNVNTYADEMILQFITGGASLDGFDQYIAQLESFNIDEAIRLTQEAYDSYVSR